MKMSIFGQIWALLGQTRIFPKNPMRSLLSLYSPLTSCKKSEKNKRAVFKKTMKMSILDQFGHFWAKRDFSQTCEWFTILPTHNVHHFSPFPAKTNDSILRNYRKSQFLGILGPFCPFLGQMGIFAKNDYIILNVLWYSVFMQRITKNDQTVQKIVV